MAVAPPIANLLSLNEKAPCKKREFPAPRAQGAAVSRTEAHSLRLCVSRPVKTAPPPVGSRPTQSVFLYITEPSMVTEIWNAGKQRDAFPPPARCALDDSAP